MENREKETNGKQKPDVAKSESSKAETAAPPPPAESKKQPPENDVGLLPVFG